jgi:hypothetical protein
MFKTARRKPIFLRMAITGITGSGKSYTALKMAQTFAQGGKVAVISTDGTAHLYADKFSFDCCRLPNNHPSSYTEAIKYAVAEKYEILVIDSFSDEWAGLGGVLEVVDQAKLVGKDGWQETRKPQAVLADLMATAPIHLIVTIKADEIVTQTVDTEGKPTTIKLAGKLVQNKDMPYAFDIILTMGDPQGATAKCVVEKTRNPLLKGIICENPGSELAGAILAWLNPEVTEAEVTPENPTQPQADSVSGGVESGTLPVAHYADRLGGLLAHHGETWSIDNCMVVLGGLVERRQKKGKSQDLEVILSDLATLSSVHLIALVENTWAQMTNPTPAK